MKNRAKAAIIVFKKWLQGMLELLAFFPIIFTIGILLIPHEIWIWIASLSAFYLIGLMLGKYLSRKPRYTHLVAGLLITLSIAWLISNNIYTMVLTFISGILILDRGIRLRGMRWSRMFPPSTLWIGLIIYFLGGAIYNFAPALKPYFLYLAWIGLAYMIIALFTINSEQLKSASLPGDDAIPVLSSTILRNNRTLILLTLTVVVIVGYFNKLKDGVVWLVRRIFWFVLEAFMFLAGLFITPTSGIDESPGQGPMEIFPDEATEPSWILRVLEVAGMVVAGIVILILLWYGLKAMFRLLKRLYRHLSRILKDRISFQEDAGFIDEKESLMGFVDIGKDYVDRFQKWMQRLLEREPKWEELVDNHERIRFLYRNLLLRCMQAGYTYKNYLTPKEIGGDILEWDREKDSKVGDLTSTYDKIRYGQSGVEDTQVEELAKTFLDK